MTKQKFGITEDGHVFLLNGRGRKPVGHIACVVRERTALAQEVRAWWAEQLAAEGPLVMVDGVTEPEPETPSFEVPATALAVNGDIDLELVEMVSGD